MAIALAEARSARKAVERSAEEIVAIGDDPALDPLDERVRLMPLAGSDLARLLLPWRGRGFR